MSLLYLQADRLQELLHAHLLGLDVDPEAARRVSESLVETSLRGVDSHGVLLFPHYCRAVASGRIKCHPSIRPLREGKASLLLDADHAFGHHVGSVAMSRAMEKAAEGGIGAVGVANSTHFGAAAYFALQASRQGQIGMAFTNADALVKAFGARSAVFGTNPICFTAPLDGEEPLCLDMATSLVSWNKVMNKRRAGEELPPGWACDAAGEATTDVEAARMLEAIGGYKGYGLGMMVEIFCGLLAGGPIARELLPMYSSPIEARRSISHFFLALDVSAFVDLAEFRARLTGLVQEIRRLPPQGELPVMVPGDPQKRFFAIRSVEGIPVEESRFEEFLALDPVFSEAVS